MREFCIHENEAGQRFDKYLKKLLAAAPGSFVYKMLRKKNITLNGRKADGTEKLVCGDAVKLFLSDETFEKFSARRQVSAEYEALKDTLSGSKHTLRGSKDTLKASENTLSSFSTILPVLYEDEDILIVNKPSGMLSQKAVSSDISANEYILNYLILKGELTEEMMQTFKPSVCNRLDRNTSGILIAGKTLKGLQEMSSALKERSVQKYYRCIVKGEIKQKAYIKGWLIKDEKSNKVTVYKELPKQKEAQRIETEYRPVATGNGYSELEVHLITGRSHQIRAHLASIGHPIIGDMKYGNRQVNDYFRRECGIDSQMLHAYRLVFTDGKEVIAPCGTEFKCVRQKTEICAED